MTPGLGNILSLDVMKAPTSRLVGGLVTIQNYIERLGEKQPRLIDPRVIETAREIADEIDRRIPVPQD
jgi:hypothetical protein